MRTKIAPTSKEPVETMGRMALMQELAEWRRVGPSLRAVARAAREMATVIRDCAVFCDACGYENPLDGTDGQKELELALARLDRVSGRKGET